MNSAASCRDSRLNCQPHLHSSIMNNLQESINQAIQQRSQYWQIHDRALEQSQQLKQEFSQRYDGSMATGTLPALTSGNLPQEEVVAVMQELGQVDQTIAHQCGIIQSDNQQIAQFKRNIRNLIVGGSTLAVLLVGALILLLQQKPDTPDALASPQASLIHRSYS